MSSDFRFKNTIYFNDFEYNGKRYPIGTVVKLNDEYNRKFTDLCDKEVIITQISLWGENKHRHHLCTVYDYNGRVVARDVFVSPDEFIEEIVENPSISPQMLQPKIEYESDFENDDVKFGWLIYIIIMAFLFIFKDRWIGWIATTIYFFNWRRNQLRK